MPTASGGETIGEKKIRLAAKLTKVRALIDRYLENGTSVSIGGDSVTEMQYEKAVATERAIEEELAQLRRLTTEGADTATGMHHVRIRSWQ